MEDSEVHTEIHIYIVTPKVTKRAISLYAYIRSGYQVWR